ncbi:MAG: hypothetical protein NTZ40_10945 [Cyanobacteria bacterium]|nr:hypothetical protein [Cyanobacteriota bacterium]
MAPLSLKSKLLILLVAGALAAAGALALRQRLLDQQHQETLGGCRAIRNQVLAIKQQEFDPGVQELRQLRLNEAQARLLRQADANAYSKFAQQYEAKVVSLAEALDRLNDLLGKLQQKNCFEMKP